MRLNLRILQHYRVDDPDSFMYFTVGTDADIGTELNQNIMTL